MKITRKTGVSVVVLLGICLLTMGAYAGEYQDGGFSQYASWWWEVFSIPDPSPVDLTDAAAFYDYRDTGRVEDSGAYYIVQVAIKLGSPLLDNDAVSEIKVKHLGTQREFSLTPDQCLNFAGYGQYWTVLMRPQDWMFNPGTWSFTMIYKGSDHWMHRQTINAPAGPQLYPAKPTGIEITEAGNYIVVSWDGIGPPRPLGPYGYRVRIYDHDGICPEEYGATYNSETGRVSSVRPIATDLTGRTLRLENRWYQSVPGNANAFARAIKFLTLQPTP